MTLKSKVGKMNYSQPLINQQIPFSEILLLTEETKEILSRKEALKKAQQMDLDLVCIAPNSSPPVCKMVNYQRYLFELKKRQKVRKKTSKKGVVREIKISFHIGKEDLATKSKQILKLLESGCFVKVSLKMLDWERASQGYKELVLAKCQRIIADLQAQEGKIRLQREIKPQGKVCSFILQKGK